MSGRTYPSRSCRTGCIEGVSAPRRRPASTAEPSRGCRSSGRIGPRMTSRIGRRPLGAEQRRSGDLKARVLNASLREILDLAGRPRRLGGNPYIPFVRCHGPFPAAPGTPWGNRMEGETRGRRGDVEFVTIRSEKINFGRNNFLEVARKRATTSEGTKEFISVSRGCYLPDKTERFKRSLTIPDDAEVRAFCRVQNSLALVHAGGLFRAAKSDRGL